MRGFVDGILQGEVITGPKTIAYDSSIPLTIGGHSSLYGNRNFDGIIDEVIESRNLVDDSGPISSVS